MAGLAATLYPAVVTVVAGLSLVTTGQFVAQSLTPTLAGEVARHGRGAAGSMYYIMYYVGGSLGASTPGLIWARYHYPGVVALNEIVLLAGVVVWYVARRRADLQISSVSG